MGKFKLHEDDYDRRGKKNKKNYRRESYPRITPDYALPTEYAMILAQENPDSENRKDAEE